MSKRKAAATAVTGNANFTDVVRSWAEHAKEVPAEKGGTMFADMRAAYDGLPLPMKERLAGLTGLHGRSSGLAGERLYGDEKGATETVYTELPRPAVMRHPSTGRHILFVNPMHTHGFKGMCQEESWPLIEELAAHSTQERFVYYHRWRVGDVLMWDERATMHRGAGDYRPDERRIMLRTIVSQLTGALHDQRRVSCLAGLFELAMDYARPRTTLRRNSARIPYGPGQ